MNDTERQTGQSGNDDDSEVQGWKHPYVIYVVLTVGLFLFLVFMAWLAWNSGWIPQRRI